MKKITALFILAAVCSQLYAQTVQDALRYSTFEPAFTARATGVGGSMGALGADFSALNTNPAGLAWYRSSVFQISPLLNIANSESQLVSGDNNRSNPESRTQFGLGSAGLVIHSSPVLGDWKAFNFGIGLTRTTSFSQKISYRGSSPGTIAERWVELANGFEPSELPSVDPFEADLADLTGAIIENPQGSQMYINDLDIFGVDRFERSQTIIQKGSITEINLGMGANYKNKLLLGLALSVPILNFEETSTYSEDYFVDDDISTYNSSLVFNETLQTRGLGFNARFGMIFRASQMLRLGAAVHTPSFIALSEDFDTDLQFDFEEFVKASGETFSGGGFEESPLGEFEYNFRTPWRFIGNMGLVFGKIGFLTLEAEYLNFGNNRFSFTSDDPGFEEAEDFVNDEVSRQLGDAIRLRIGGELVYEIFRFRAGLGLDQSPFLDDDGFNEALSFGLGLREESFFLDLAWRRSTFEEAFSPYTLNNADRQQIVALDTNKDQILLTLGFRF